MLTSAICLYVIYLTLQIGFLTKAEACCGETADDPLGSTCLSPLSLGYRSGPLGLPFYMGAWGLNSGPLACTTSTLITERSPQISKCFIFFIPPSCLLSCSTVKLPFSETGRAILHAVFPLSGEELDRLVCLKAQIRKSKSGIQSLMLLCFSSHHFIISSPNLPAVKAAEWSPAMAVQQNQRGSYLKTFPILQAFRFNSCVRALGRCGELEVMLLHRS